MNYNIISFDLKQKNVQCFTTIMREITTILIIIVNDITELTTMNKSVELFIYKG